MKHELSRALLKRHELFAELLDVVARQLVELGVAADQAQLVAAFIVDFLGEYWAGQSITFPKDEHYQLTLKELEAWDMYTGGNIDQVARHFKMTPRGMRKLLDRIRERIRAWREAEAAPGQLDLLGGPQPDSEGS
jgi:Mor family transcriptional regulator